MELTEQIKAKNEEDDPVMIAVNMRVEEWKVWTDVVLRSSRIYFLAVCILTACFVADFGIQR